MKAFVSGTGTGIGKTHLTAALAARLRSRGRRVAAVKPIETGCTPVGGALIGADATLLAARCGQPGLASAQGFHRVEPPLSPFAATLRGAPACPPARALAHAVHAAVADADDWLVEGAGGLYVPTSPTDNTADLVRALDLPVLLVAPNRLGVQSDVLAYLTSARVEGIRIACVILNQPEPPDDASRDNATVLRALSAVPVISMPQGEPPPDALDAIASCVP